MIRNLKKFYKAVLFLFLLFSLSKFQEADALAADPRGGASGPGFQEAFKGKFLEVAGFHPRPEGQGFGAGSPVKRSENVRESFLAGPQEELTALNEEEEPLEDAGEEKGFAVVIGMSIAYIASLLGMLFAYTYYRKRHVTGTKEAERKRDEKT